MEKQIIPRTEAFHSHYVRSSRLSSGTAAHLNPGCRLRCLSRYPGLRLLPYNRRSVPSPMNASSIISICLDDSIETFEDERVEE